jgi:tripartite-type tricarboxylate transporter receptor subunit TctC
MLLRAAIFVAPHRSTRATCALVCIVIVARIVADKLGRELGQPVIVENRPGAAERIGAEFVAKAKPDGYTLLAAPPASLVISPLLFSHLAYDPKAFVPITVLTSSHLVLLTSPSLSITSLAIW